MLNHIDGNTTIGLFSLLIIYLTSYSCLKSINFVKINSNNLYIKGIIKLLEINAIWFIFITLIWYGSVFFHYEPLYIISRLFAWGLIVFLAIGAIAQVVILLGMILKWLGR